MICNSLVYLHKDRINTRGQFKPGRIHGINTSITITTLKCTQVQNAQNAAILLLKAKPQLSCRNHKCRWCQSSQAVQRRVSAEQLLLIPQPLVYTVFPDTLHFLSGLRMKEHWDKSSYRITFAKKSKCSRHKWHPRQCSFTKGTALCSTAGELLRQSMAIPTGPRVSLAEEIPPVLSAAEDSRRKKLQAFRRATTLSISSNPSE